MSEVRGDQLTKQALAAKTLKEALQTDDDELLRDMIEGETGFVECLTKVLHRIDDDTLLVNGIIGRVGELDERKERLTKRIDRARACIEAAMMVSESPKIETPIGTVSPKRLPPSLNLIDEHKIPAGYWKRGEPQLDRKAIVAALKRKEHVPGASLNNGGMTIQIRTK